jgi:hypothetical protein
MASHAHNSADSGDPVSAAKITAYGGVGVAIIGLIGTIVGLMLNHTSSNSEGPSPAAITPASAAVTPTPTATNLSNGAPDTGLRFSPLINGILTVSGSTQKDVIGMYVVIGPKSSSGGYDTGCGNVMNQRWQAEVATDASWPNYPLVTVPAYGSCVGATSASALKFTFQGTKPTTPPPPPDQILDCAKQNGPSCFNGPGFGPPTTYQPNQ